MQQIHHPNDKDIKYVKQNSKQANQNKITPNKTPNTSTKIPSISTKTPSMQNKTQNMSIKIPKLSCIPKYKFTLFYRETLVVCKFTHFLAYNFQASMTNDKYQV